MDPDILALAQKYADNYLLDRKLVCAVCEQESSWIPTAIRMEPGFFQRYIKPMNLPPMESIGRSTSFGLMQVMGEVARELGFQGAFDQLIEPATALDLGCQFLKRKLFAAKGDVPTALQMWNGGGNPNYANQVMARMSKY